MKRIIALLSLLSLIVSFNVIAAPKSEYWAFWDKSKDQSHRTINHTAWDDILGRYLTINHQSGVNRFRYGDVSSSDNKKLNRYIKSLTKLDPREYNRHEQKAYWMNLYNALTVQLVIKNYPVESITDIGGVFSSGPWNKDLIKLEGKKLSLNDIEHRILRPLWKDHKIHFGVVCASVSCPNLQPVAFTGRNVDRLLKKAGKEYINHPRGVHLEKGVMQVSSIFDWYGDDFSKDKKKLTKILAHYADDRLALYLLGFKGKIKYDYDWALNE